MGSCDPKDHRFPKVFEQKLRAEAGAPLCRCHEVRQLKTVVVFFNGPCHLIHSMDRYLRIFYWIERYRVDTGFEFLSLNVAGNMFKIDWHQ